MLRQRSKLFRILLTAILIIVTHQQCLTPYEYLDSTYSICMPCGYSCVSCIDSSACTTCVDQFFVNQATNLCQKCPFGCMYCTNSTTCITCNTGLYINSKGNCLPCSTGVSSCSIAVIQQCHDGYFLLGGICAQCLDNCKTCEDFVTCNECSLGYYLSSNSQQCLSCGSNCEICSDSSTCISCIKGYTISNGQCVVKDCSMYDFCATCDFGQCLSCNKGKYLDTNSNKCVQGASILCEQSTGPFYSNCDVNFQKTCSNYAQVQYDQISSQKLSLCLPLSATQYAEYIYLSNFQQSNCMPSTCGSAYSQLLTITTRKSYYQVQYHLNIRLYKSSLHDINIAAINSSTQVVQVSNTHSISIAQQLTIFTQSQSNCSGCQFGQVYVTGSLISNGYQQSLFNVSDANGAFTIIEYVFVFSTCGVENCQLCTTASDCVLCIQLYFLQLVKCVTQCDAGFYQYQRYCLLQCPSDTYPIQSSYQCQACVSPCLTCSSQTQCLSCVDGYFLEGQSCVIACSSAEQFGNTTSKQCQPCPNPCQTCQAVNSTYVKCLSCMVGYLYQQQSCVFICPTSYYDTFLNEISQCSICDTSCSDCYLSSTTCSGCNSGYLLYESYCNQTASCPNGYFISVNNTCSACQFPCATCQSLSINCTSCLKGGLYQNKCHSSCPDGYFMDVSTVANITCQECPVQCTKCLSLTICESCASGYYLFNSQCLPTCTNQSFYANPTNNTCTPCPAPCKQCTSSTDCLSCLTGYLDGNSCTLKCNTSAYINSAFQCNPCPSRCSECYSQSQCIKCTLPHVLNSTNCITVSDCTSLGKYISYTYDQTNTTLLYGQCKQCTYPCASCATSSILCSTCVTGYFYLPDMKTCQQQCPSTYYLNSTSSECLKCSSNCYQCSISATNCTSCSTGTYLNTLANQCISTCPDGYYADNEQAKCQQCVSPCATCYNIYFCKSCSIGIYYNKVCVTTCPSGTIYNSTSNQCVSCTNNCLTCSVTVSNCTSCISGYFFFSGNNTCVLTCIDGYYADIYTQGCEQCVSPCMKCTSQTQCISCVSDYYLESDKSCVLTCSTQYFANALTFTCDLCNLTVCSACNITANNCTSCANGYFYDSLLSSSCVSTCPTGYYSQPMTRTCKACVFPCTQCANTTYCTSCSTNYKLYLNRCYSSCPVGYFGTSTCQQCATNCQICTSITTCTKCVTNYYVENGLCVTDCSLSLYKGKQDMTNYDYCVSCPANCLNCADYTTCVNCTNGFYLFNGLCLSECPILHYADIPLMTCKQCPINCVSCVNDTYCTKCVNSYIYQNQCQQKCPQKTYVFNEQKCLACQSPCETCSSQFQCITCVSGYLYYSGYCVQKCPSDVWYYPHNDSCSATCPYNKYEDGMICYVSGCGGRYVEMNGYCLKSCPIGYYVSQQQSCIPCSTNQQICNDLFIADLQILRSQHLTLTLYYSQKAQTIPSFQQINVTFSDSNNQVINQLALISCQFTPYSLSLKYSYQSVEFINVQMTIPYINSLTTAQAISQCYYTTTLYYFNNYQDDKQSTMFTLASIIPVILSAGLFVCIIANIVSKTSYFLQLLDFMQLTAACLYLDIQYPQYLQHFLSKLSLTLFSFMPMLIQHYPFVFSSPKYIYHNVDTSLSRTHGLTFIVFIVLLLMMTICIAIDKYFKPLPKLVDRVKYRNLNDLFSIFVFPLLLFSFPFTHAIVIDILLGIVVIVITLSWVIFISNLIISAKEMGDLKGLLSDYEAVSNKLGLMYTPFSYIRRIIVALLFAIFPYKPLAALTLLLIFTILILICLFFYQPFASQVTDYVSMGMEFTLIVFIVLIVLIGLDIFPQGANRVAASIAIIIVSIAMAVGLGWLGYLTFSGFRKFCQNPNKQEEKDTQDCIRQQKHSQSINQPHNKQTQHHQAQYSATNLMQPNKKKNKNNIIQEDLQNDNHSHSNKQQFKHWNDEDQQQQSQQQGDNYNKNQKTKKNGRLPQMLMKKKIQTSINKQNQQQDGNNNNGM